MTMATEAQVYLALLLAMTAVTLSLAGLAHRYARAAARWRRAAERAERRGRTWRRLYVAARPELAARLARLAAEAAEDPAPLVWLRFRSGGPVRVPRPRVGGRDDAR